MTSHMATKNRRRHLRTRASNLVAHLRIGDRSVVAPVEDISMGGAFLRTGEPIAHGTLLAFDVARPGLKRPLRLMGLVVDSRARGIGLRFNGLDPETTDRLGDLMRDLGGVVGATMADPIEGRPAAPSAPPQPALTPTHAQFQTTTQTAQPQIVVPPQNPGALPRTGTPVSMQAPFPQPTQTGTFSMQQPPVDEASRMMVQLRGAIMEIGNLQQQLVQKDRELADLREKIGGDGDERRRREATEGIVGKLEMEKMRLQEQLARTRGDVDTVKREADSVVQAVSRLVEAIKRLG